MSDHAWAVVLAGGYGERFWPVSTVARPKQLLTLLGERTMLEMAVDRLAGVVPPERVLVLTGADLVAATVERTPGLPPANVIGEPVRRDTAAAIALAAAVVAARDPEGVFCVVTADHVMGDIDRFRATLAAGLAIAARADVLVTIGITPDHPSTAFGYIETGDAFDRVDDIDFRRVARFVEKPDLATATEYVDSGRFLWNSGMFAWSVAAVRTAFAEHAPALADAIDRLVPAVDTTGFEAAVAAVFEQLDTISIDYALMERADNIVVAEGRFAWSDVGSWPSVADHVPTDEHANAIVGDVQAIDSSGNVVVSDGRLTALIGVDDLIVVHADGATLICHRDRAQDVKALVTRLRADGRWDHLL